MKGIAVRIFAITLVISLLMCSTDALAAEAGVVIIPSQENPNTQAVSLDDIKLKAAVDIPDYCLFTPTEFSFLDECLYCDYTGYDYYDSFKSGVSADYALLWFTVLSYKTEDIDFLKEISSIVVTYNDKYMYSGFSYQCDPALEHPEAAIKYPENNFVISPMYDGYFMVGCALPNAVINGKEPLKLTFKLGENEITYNIRK